MKCLCFVAAVCMIAVPALASPELLPAKGPHYATYTMATGELTPTPGPVRYGGLVWGAFNWTGWYWNSHGNGCLPLDWGDCGNPSDPYLINGFRIWYQPTAGLPSLDTIVWFYGEENGWNSYAHVPLAGFRMNDLPTNPNFSWLITVDLAGGFEFLLEGSDVDADGLVDFGYTYWFLGPSPTQNVGPVIAGLAGDPNGNAPGQEDSFDWYEPNDPNQGLAYTYVGTYYFGSDPFAQFAMQIFEGNAPNEPNEPSPCPNPGGSGKYCFADIDCGNPPCDCIVGLPDLAMLLSNYGMTTGATHGDGDVEPAPPNGDGDVDLGDLAELLSQYGDDCRE